MFIFCLDFELNACCFITISSVKLDNEFPEIEYNKHLLVAYYVNIIFDVISIVSLCTSNDWFN